MAYRYTTINGSQKVWLVRVAYKGRRIVVNQGKIGATAQKLYDTIVAIQYGQAPDPHGWTLVV